MEDINSRLSGAGDRAPPLTLDNVLKAVEGVGRSWQELTRGSSAFGVDTDSIIRQYDSDEARLEAVVEKFLLGEGRYQPSWRAVIYSLDEISKIHLADKIRSYGEPVQDPTMTTDNVTQVFEVVNDDLSLSYDAVSVIIPRPQLIAIREKSSTKRKKSTEYASYYIQYHPECSWVYLATFLYRWGEFAAVEKTKPFLPPRDLTISTKKVNELFSMMKDELVDRFGEMLDLPSSKRREIKKNYHSPAQRRDTYIDTYINEHPHPTWKVISVILNSIKCHNQANEVERKYVKVNQQTEKNFTAAMRDGEIFLRSGSSFMLGAAGSGKTHFIHAFLKEKSPLVRESTPCAKKSIRTVAQYKLRVSNTKADQPSFDRTTEQQFSSMFSRSARYPIRLDALLISRHKNISQEEASASNEAEFTAPPTKKSRIELPTNSGSLVQFDQSGFARQLCVRMDVQSTSSDRLDNKTLLDIKDSAGQSMFHEVLPMFVSNTTCGFLTVKLNESLDSHPEVEYFKEGVRLGKSFRSPFSHLQISSNCIKVVHSTCEKGKRPKLVFIGTHADLEHQCKDETRDDKNRKLLSIIPPQMRDCVIPYRTESLIFPINGLNPGKKDQAVLDILRRVLLTELQKIPPVRIPHRYFALEMAFQQLAKEKPILSREECFQEARNFHFKRESFPAVLTYLKGIKLIMHFEEVLPKVVFIDAQVLLDKITELVEYSLQIQSGSYPSDLTPLSRGEYEKLNFHGKITREILSRFKSGYVPGLFEEKHLILVFEHLLIIAKVGEGEYLMPCLLQAEEIPHPLPDSASLNIPSLLFYFGEEGPKLGVYCALLSSLITESHWELLMKDRTPVQLSRNCARFKMPGKRPGFVTITDSISDTYLQVDITFPSKISSSKALEVGKVVCPLIRKTIFSGIRKASQRLNYTDSIPEAAVFCSEQHEPNSLHPATISDDGLLTCTHDTSLGGEISKSHRLQIWLGGDVSSSSESATSAQAASGQKNVKSGQIKDPDSLFNDIAIDISDKYMEVGIDLGLESKVMRDELETGVMKMQIGSKKAFKMLSMWLASTTQDQCTYFALATALEKNGLQCYAHKYCYTIL